MSWITWIIFKFIAPITMLGILVFIHELGHFLVAKWCGVGVLKFSLGFGPAICKFKKGETEYQISIIPLGGYVRMLGDMPDPITGEEEIDEKVRTESEAESHLESRKNWFIHKTALQKSAIVFAGPFFNLILTIVIIFLCVAIYGEKEPILTPTIGSIMEDSPAQRGGLEKGDLVKSINEKEINTWQELQETIYQGNGEQLNLKIIRNGVENIIRVQPELKIVKTFAGEEEKHYLLGVGPLEEYETKPASISRAALISFIWTYDKAYLNYKGIWGMITGKVSTDQIAGPLYIVKLTGNKAEEGLEGLLYLTAFLSISLAVLNLLPIPILDGGHILFFLLEAIIGPISIKKKELAQNVGLALLLFLMVFALKNDLTRKSEVEPKEKVKWQEFGQEKTEQTPKQEEVQK